MILTSTAPPQQQPAPPAPLHVIKVTCEQVSPIPDPSFGGFRHTGHPLLGPAEFALFQQRVAAVSAANTVGTYPPPPPPPPPPPFEAAVASLRADTPAVYVPHALKDVLVEWYDGPKIGHHELVELDGQMVYMQVGR